MKIRNIKRWIRRRWVKSRSLRQVYFPSILIGAITLYLICPVAIGSHTLSHSGIAGVLIEPRVMDLWFLIRGRRPAPKDILLIGVDEKSFDVLGLSPLKAWPREKTAELLERLAKVKPKTVFLDFTYRVETDPAVDKRLAKAMALNRTFIAEAVEFKERVGPDGKLKTEVYQLKPAKIFDRVADTFLVNMPLDAGVVRRFKTGKGTEDNITPVAAALFGDKAHQHELPGPWDYINYYGPPGSVATISFYQALQMPEEELRRYISNRYIFVGQQLFIKFRKEQSDAFLTPFQAMTAGVEIHATVAGNLLENSWIRSLNGKTLATLAMTISALSAFFILSSQPVAGLIIMLALIFFWAAGSYIAFSRFNLFIPGAVFFFGILPIVYAISTVRFFLRSRKLEEAIGLKSKITKSQQKTTL